MPQSTSNLVPLQQFGTTQTGGTTTGALAFQTPKPNVSPTQSYPSLATGNFNTTTSLPTPQISTQQSVPYALGVSPQPAPQPGLVPTTPPTVNSGVIDYTLHKGESIPDYNARIAAARGSSTPPSQTSTTPNTVGQKAPPGMEYNGQGQLVPLPGQTNNSQGQTVPIPQNINTGGGTQTNFPSIVGGLASTASQPSEQYINAQNQYLRANQELQTLQKNAAIQNANIGGSRTNLAEAGGEQGLLQNLVSGQQAALTGEMSAAQAAAQAATGQQGTQQSGLTAAGNLVAPQGANIYGTYNPLNPNQYTQYGGGQGGGAATAGGVQSQVQQGAAVQQMTGQQAQAQALATNLTNLINQAGINPNNMGITTNFANGVKQWIEKQTGDPQYQNFANLINEISSRYASILNQSGGTPTDQSTLSHQIINGLASGQDIKTVLAQLDKNATDSINALKNSAQGNSASGSQSNSGGQSNFYSSNWFSS